MHIYEFVLGDPHHSETGRGRGEVLNILLFICCDAFLYYRSRLGNIYVPWRTS